MTCNHDGPRLPWPGFDDQYRSLCAICGCFLIGDQEAWRLLRTDQQQSLQRYGAQEVEKQAWNSGGVYVYSYPHYLTHPYHPQSGRTLYKVGKADRVINRVAEQIRSTAMPEDPQLLRVYAGGVDHGHAERCVHRALYTRSHHHSGRFCGEEWFLTDLPTLDLLAGQCGLITSFNYHQLQQHLQERLQEQLQEQEQLQQQEEEAS